MAICGKATYIQSSRNDVVVRDEMRLAGLYQGAYFGERQLCRRGYGICGFLVLPLRSSCGRCARGILGGRLNMPDVVLPSDRSPSRPTQTVSQAQLTCNTAAANTLREIKRLRAADDVLALVVRYAIYGRGVQDTRQAFLCKDDEWENASVSVPCGETWGRAPHHEDGIRVERVCRELAIHIWDAVARK